MIFGKTPSRIQGACFGLAAFLAAQSVAGAPTEALDRALANIAEGNHKRPLVGQKRVQVDSDFVTAELHPACAALKSHRLGAALRPNRDTLCKHPKQLGEMLRVAALGGVRPEYDEELPEEKPEFPQTYYVTAGAKWKSGDLEGARADLAKALHIKPDFIEAWVALASVELESGRVEESLRLAKKLQRDMPNSPTGFAVEGDIYDAGDRPADAAEAYLQAYARENSRELAMKLATAYYRAGKSKAAAPILEEWLKQQPGDGDALKLLAFSYHASERANDAIDVYRKLLEVDPRDPTLLNNLARLLFERDPSDWDALQMSTKAYALASEQPEVADNHGWILLHNDRLDDALPILRNAFAADPGNPVIGYHLAMALERAGLNQEARDLLKGLIEQAPEGNGLQQAREMLERMGG